MNWLKPYRRLWADSLDALGDVWVQDVVYQAQQTGGEEDLTMTVYYHDESRPR